MPGRPRKRGAGVSGEWFYAVAGEQAGPVSWDDLRRLVEQRTLTAADLVWNESMEEWAEAATVEGLVPQTPAARKPPPLPKKTTPSALPDATMANRVTLEVRVAAAGGVATGGTSYPFDLLLDGKKVGSGNMVEGMLVTLETTVGQHTFTLANTTMDEIAEKGGVGGWFAGLAKGIQTSQAFPVGFTAPGHYEVIFPVKPGQRTLPNKIEVTKK
jgi:hypothetical protein